MKICNLIHNKYMQKENRKFKIGITIVLGLLLVCCYVVIFLFSADNAEDSSAISRKLAEALVRFYHTVFEGDSGGGIQGTGMGFNETELVEKLIRKLAHFTEYMILGILSYLLAKTWIKQRKICVAVVAIQLFVSAGLDEFHQSFVPGRYASFWDVLLDTAGGMTGVLLVILFINLHGKNKKKRVTG